jgi:hypothetical protein
MRPVKKYARAHVWWPVRANALPSPVTKSPILTTATTVQTGEGLDVDPESTGGPDVCGSESERRQRDGFLTVVTMMFRCRRTTK